MMISCHQALYAISMRNDLAKHPALPKLSLRTYLCLQNTAIAVAGAEAMARKDLGSTAIDPYWLEPGVLVRNWRSCLLAFLIDCVEPVCHFIFLTILPLGGVSSILNEPRGSLE